MNKYKMQKIKILVSFTIGYILLSCSAWDNRKQIFELILRNNDKPQIEAVIIAPEEKNIVDVLQIFSEANHAPKVEGFSKIIICTSNWNLRAVFQIRQGYYNVDRHIFKRDLRNFTATWEVYENEGRTPKKSYSFKYTDFENLTIGYLRYNGIRLFDESFRRE
jgi:hypothetical protein